MKNSISDTAIRQVIFISIIIALGLLLLTKLKMFIPSFLGAYTILLISDSYYNKLIAKGWRPGNAAFIILLIVAIAIIIPIGLFVNFVSREFFPYLSNPERLMQSFNEMLSALAQKTGYTLQSDKTLNQIAEYVSQNITSALGSGAETILQVIMTLFIAFFLIKERKIVDELYDYLPLAKDNIEKVRSEVRKLVNANAIGIPVVALSQSLTALIGYFIFGVPNPIFWFALSCVATLIPIVGGALSYMPLVVVLFATGNQMNAIGLLIYGLLIIGTIDNVIRFTLLKRMSDIHPLVTVLGVLAGLQLFGFIGIIFGPIMINIFLIAIRIYREEYILRHQADHHPEVE